VSDSDEQLADLDLRSAADIVRAVVGGHHRVLDALEAAEPAIAALVERALERLAPSGRVVYVGAGSSGQVALLDASEWDPTFSPPETLVVVLRPGADLPPGSPEEAAAEDDAPAGEADARALELGAADVVIGVSAGGTTPYVVAALRVARQAGALTAAVTSEPGSPLARLADCPIAVPVGPEVISGSTRLKAGTAQKLVLNAFSTALMVRKGRTLGNLMAGMRVADAKLRERAVRVCELATGCDPEAARTALTAAGWEVDVAILVLGRGIGAGDARNRLAAACGAVRAALVGPALDGPALDGPALDGPA
jgi:N-acetylmuramic acid 6-phosphate etherase